IDNRGTCTAAGIFRVNGPIENASSYTLLASKMVSLSGPVDLRFDVVGSSLGLSINGVLQVSATDTTLTSGQVGAFIDQGQALGSFAAYHASAMPFSDSFASSSTDPLDDQYWVDQAGSFGQVGGELTGTGAFDVATYSDAPVADVSLVTSGVDVSGPAIHRAGLVARYN